jgi:hypothetical protein
MSNYSTIIQNYEMDPTNACVKNVEHYIKGLYVKQNSYNTIENYEKLNNIKFDFIITLRTDIYLDKHLFEYYEKIMNNLYNTVYVANSPKFNIYNNPSLPDVICIANKEITKKIVDQLSNLSYCVVNNSNFFHPETSFYNALKHLDLNILELELKAFPRQIDSIPIIYY